MNKDQVYPLYVRNVLNTSILSSQDLKVLFRIRFTSIISFSKSSGATWAKPGSQHFLGLFITNSNNYDKKESKYVIFCQNMAKNKNLAKSGKKARGGESALRGGKN